MAPSSRDVIARSEAFARAERFGATVRGFPVSYRGDGIVGFKAGAFCRYVEQGPAHAPEFEFLVADVAATRARSRAAGCALVEEDPAVPRCWVRDPSGVTFDIGRSPGAQLGAVAATGRR